MSVKFLKKLSGLPDLAQNPLTPSKLNTNTLFLRLLKKINEEKQKESLLVFHIFFFWIEVEGKKKSCVPPIFLVPVSVYFIELWVYIWCITNLSGYRPNMRLDFDKFIFQVYFQFHLIYLLLTVSFKCHYQPNSCRFAPQHGIFIFIEFTLVRHRNTHDFLFIEFELVRQCSAHDFF